MKKTALEAMEEFEVARRDLWLAIVRALRLDEIASWIPPLVHRLEVECDRRVHVYTIPGGVGLCLHGRLYEILHR